jgi:hypothetical protein
MTGVVGAASRALRGSGAWPSAAVVAVALTVACSAPDREAGMDHESGADAASPAATPYPLPTVRLPAAVDGWARFGEERRVDPDAIFSYMDGAGELYLAYRFDHLSVVEYRAADAPSIQVELYIMHGSDDAFGLLSFDWGGEPVALGDLPPGGAAGSGWPRALYGGGLLRLWAGPVYARIMAAGESAAARRAVLSLGRAVAATLAPGAPPGEVSGLAEELEGGWALRRDSVCFLRSHLVLNQAYYLSQADLLDLDRSVAAVTARYDRRAPAGRAQLVAVRYPSAARARAARDHFRQSYLPDAAQDATADSFTRIEAGWVGTRLAGRCVAVALDCTDADVARALLAAGETTLSKGDGCHE